MIESRGFTDIIIKISFKNKLIEVYIYTQITRIAFFILYTWYGILKVLNLSDAYDLVSKLSTILLPSIDPHTFFLMLGIVEIYIGILFLFKRLTLLAIILASIHLLATFLPYIFLQEQTWNGFGILTMEGQYILKNLFIISALAGLTIFRNFKSNLIVE